MEEGSSAPPDALGAGGGPWVLVYSLRTQPQRRQPLGVGGLVHHLDSNPSGPSVAGTVEALVALGTKELRGISLSARGVELQQRCSLPLRTNASWVGLVGESGFLPERALVPR
jgi:hypothetical protein